MRRTTGRTPGPNRFNEAAGFTQRKRVSEMTNCDRAFVLQ